MDLGLVEVSVYSKCFNQWDLHRGTGEFEVRGNIRMSFRKKKTYSSFDESELEVDPEPA
jgi:hypothetical protein